MPTEMLHDADDEKLPDEHEELGEEQEGMRVYADCNERYEEVDGIETVLDDVIRRRERNASVQDMSRCQVLAYSIGHFFNDLCSSLWFTYLMIYLSKVVQLDNTMAGLLMWLGQATDAVSTPIVGLLSDAAILPSCLAKFGRRKSWHIIGTICVTLSFPFIFSGCFLCTKSSPAVWRVLWFAPSIMLFQFGWAAVQISHLAMIPELSQNPSRRTSMNSMRNAFSVIANITIYVALFVLLRNDTNSEDVNPTDMIYFREKPYQRLSSSTLSLRSDASSIVQMSWRNWFSQGQFYQVGLLYMFCRLYINVSQVYFSFYITDVRELNKQFVAVLPLVSYLSSFVISCLMGVSTVNKLFNRKALFLIAALVGILNSATVLFTEAVWSAYAIAVLLGVSQALLLISSLGVTAQLINRNTESGAFVYGAMSFMDKLSNGVVVLVIQVLLPDCQSGHKSPLCKLYFKDIMAFVPGVCVLCIFVLLLCLNTKKLGQRQSRPRDDDDNLSTEDLLSEPVF